MSGDRPAMYEELADWFHLLTAPAEYEEEAAILLGILRERVDGPLETLLELGAGGGNTASHLKASLRLTLTDLSEAMLRQSRAINPECEHVAGNMRTLRYLEWTFDPDRSDTTFVTEFAIIVREADGTARAVHDRHVEGLFPRSIWLTLLGEAGFEASTVGDRWGRDLFVARKPGPAVR